MKGKIYILILAVFLLCMAPINSTDAMADTTETAQKDYTLTVVEDEEVPLAQSSSKSYADYYVLYTVAAIIGTIFFFTVKSIERRKQWEKQELEVARVYMDDLIQ